MKLTGLLIRYLFLLISMATLGLKLLSSSMASSSSSSLKYCSLEVDILDCILEALVDILDCILEVLVDILDPDILVLTFAVAQTPLPHPLSTIEHSGAKSYCHSPLFKKLPRLKWSIVSLRWSARTEKARDVVVLHFPPKHQLMRRSRAESRQEP